LVVRGVSAPRERLGSPYAAIGERRPRRRPHRVRRVAGAGRGARHRRGSRTARRSPGALADPLATRSQRHRSERAL